MSARDRHHSRSYHYARAEEFRRRPRKPRTAQPNPNTILEGDDDLDGPTEDERFSERVVAEALSELFIPLEDISGRHIGNCEINLGTLQRMNIHAIQRDLLRLTSEIVRSRRMTVRPDHAGPIPRRPSQSLELRELMKEYCTAWRDWELILKSTSEAERDPFRLTTHTSLTANLIEDAGFLTHEMISMAQGNVPEAHKLTLLLREASDRKSHSKLPGSSRHAKLREDKVQEAIQRFIWGMGGGLALIAPMLIMVLHKTLLTTLLTSSVAVILLAFSVAVISSGLLKGTTVIDLGPRDVLAITATYAAVLVVFVGANS